jgi:hypothetical protein
VTDVASMIGPASRLPMGTVPPKPIIHRAVIRPRSRLVSRSCRTVDRDVRNAKYVSPTRKTRG